MDSLLLVKSLATLAAILALIFGCFIIVRRRSLNRLSPNKRLAILEYQRIDQKNCLCLIKADTQEYLVALGQASVTILPLSPRN